MSNRRLLIISDSPMWMVGDEVFVFEPTLREVEALSDLFSSIMWLGYNHGDHPKEQARPTKRQNVIPIPLHAVAGGENWRDKLGILPRLPKLWRTIVSAIRDHHYIHTRGPSVPALLAVLFSYLDRTRVYWHKYAGNWKQPNAPLAYSLQRCLLRNCRHSLTVNGQWPGEPKHIVNFENPCLTEEELKSAAESTQRRSYELGASICFVGALTNGKGVREFLQSIELLEHGAKIREIVVAGDGPLRKELEDFSKRLRVRTTFLGSVGRKQIEEVYKAADMIVLPSASEGFPKVVAEAAAFGCIPVVSDVSSISQYIVDGKSGILLRDREVRTIASAIDRLLSDPNLRARMAQNLTCLPHLFTYERYCLKVESLLFT